MKNGSLGPPQACEKENDPKEPKSVFKRVIFRESAKDQARYLALKATGGQNIERQKCKKKTKTEHNRKGVEFSEEVAGRHTGHEGAWAGG